MLYSLCMKRSSRLFLAGTVVVLLVAASTIAVRHWTSDIATTASTGRTQAEAGARSLAAMDATSAASQFRAADRSFASITRALGPEWISGPAGSIPWLGRQYVAARSLSRIGSDGSVAGMELAEALRQSPAATATPDQTGQLGGLLSSRLAHARVALTAYDDAAARAGALSADGLVPPLADAVRTIQAGMAKAAPLVDRGRPLIQLGSYLLSGSHRIIVVSQDGAELRPTGGWAGSFGIVDVGSAGVKLESYQDVFVLPSPPGNVTPPLGALQTKRFNFRNANWWLDFPTSAQTMLGFWRTYGQAPVDGIVVVDTVVMQNLLSVVGPIAVPRFKETFTSENLLGRLLYLTQVQRGGQPDRKNVLVELANELEKRVLGASPGELAKSAIVLGKAADAKHVQMYFLDPGAQAAADALGWSGRVAPPQGTTDVVAVSNAMNKPGKVNIAMKKAIAYDVRLKSDRSADTTLVLGYANTGPYLQYLPPDFRDWLRVYRAPGTIFPPTKPDGSKTTTFTEFGFPAEARMFTVARGQTHAETLTARVPGALRTSSAFGGGSAHYRLYMVRQADLQDIPTVLTVNAPPGWQVGATSARLVASGASLPIVSARDRVRVTVPLSGDLTLDVELKSTSGATK
jgi:hypothetical protein